MATDRPIVKRDTRRGSWTVGRSSYRTRQNCTAGSVRGGRRPLHDGLVGWRRGVVVSGVRRINEVNPRRAPLVLGWVTVFGQVYHLDM